MSPKHERVQHFAAHEAHIESPTIIESLAQKKYSTACPAPIYHALDRTWAKNANIADIDRRTCGPTQQWRWHQQPQRWMEEKAKEQPWNSVEGFAAASSPRASRARRDTGSSSAVARSARQ